MVKQLQAAGPIDTGYYLLRTYFINTSYKIQVHPV